MREPHMKYSDAISWVYNDEDLFELWQLSKLPLRMWVRSNIQMIESHSHKMATD